jgi:hypothetical protein
MNVSIVIYFRGVCCCEIPWIEGTICISISLKTAENCGSSVFERRIEKVLVYPLSNSISAETLTF